MVEMMMVLSSIFFYWHWMPENNVLTNPEGAQSLGKEFSASATWVFQGKSPFQWLIGRFCTKEDMISRLIIITLIDTFN